MFGFTFKGAKIDFEIFAYI